MYASGSGRASEQSEVLSRWQFDWLGKCSIAWSHTARAYCDLWTVFPKVISGLRRPIAIQAVISFSMNLPE
jgi:hypothetical protein